MFNFGENEEDMNLIDRIKSFSRLQKEVNDKPKSKFRFGWGKGLLRRKNRLEENPLLAYATEHPFKPVKKIAINNTVGGHSCIRLMKKMRLGKLKPKQYRLATERINSAGIDFGY